MSSRSGIAPQPRRCGAVPAILCVGLLALTGCGGGSAPATPEPAPARVGIISVHAGPVSVTRELVGRLSAVRAADVRARVAGVVQRRLYREGSDVRAGQPLFQIDPAPFRAALDAALAALAQAQATATNAHVTAQRYRDLVPSGLVSRSDLDNAEATERSTAAAVQQARANAESARINLGYATVRAPIGGRAGQQGVTEGALVGQGSATLLTTVEQIDPIYVNFDQPAAELERLRRAQAAGSLTMADRNQALVQLTLADGTAYGRPGTLDFRDASVDPATGAVALRATVPNPDRQLLPGMYVNVRLTVATVNHGFLVPQAALLRDNTGPYVLVVGTDANVQQKRVTADLMRGTDWIVTGGLEEGDRVIVSGVQAARPGHRVAVVTGAGPGAPPSAAR